MTNDELNVNGELANAENKPEEVNAEVNETPVVNETETVAEEARPAEAEETAVVAEVAAAVENDDDEPTVEKLKAPQIQQVSLENFDWDAIGKKHENYSSDERSKLESLYDKTLSSIVEHEVIDGTVVAISSREVVVNIGFKSDGVIPQSELRYNPNLKIGDKIEVYVESQEDMGGQLLLSHKKARILRSWERVNQAFEKEEIIDRKSVV